ncbi:MAG TPA: DUF6515 family protein [Steroidobacteraceae bacterium]
MSRIAAVYLSLILSAAGIQPAAAADEHARPEQPAPQNRGVPAPRAGAPAPRPAYDGHGQVLDSRYNHGRYYPPQGAVRPALPTDYRPYYRGGQRYYFNGGVWYAPHGTGFVVVRPPVGVVIAVLPAYYSTVWFGGIPYYYANNVYYSWQPDQNGYAVVDPPDNADAPSSPPDDAQQDPQQDLIVYPKNGQAKEQQSADQYDCNNWAKGQTGFDPTQPDGTAGNSAANRNNYDRATAACLTARGYQVN